jgi:DNA-binding ferritin-like protein
MHQKHHWQVSGPTFHPLRLLFDRHFEAQMELVDQIAERVHMLGGITIAMAQDVVQNTVIPRAAKGREYPPKQDHLCGRSREERSRNAHHRQGHRQHRHRIQVQ